MAQRKKKMNGKFYYFPEGMSLEKKNGKPRIAVTVKIGGKISRKYFPATEQGYNSARDVAASIREEKKRYGAEFGSVTEDEKMAIDMWRQYRELCIRERCEYKSMSEVMEASLSNVVEISISPTVEEAAQKYIDEKLRKNNGVLTDHLQTVNNRLRRIVNELGDIRMCNLTVKQIDDFLQGLMNPRKKTKAEPRTIRQYLSLIKSVSSMVEKRGLLDAMKNAAKNMELPKPDPKDPDILSLDEVCKIFEYVRDNPQEHVFIPVLAVGFFCGARLSERSRLTHADILRGDRDEVYLSRMITKKYLPRYTYTYANFKAWMDFARDHGVKMETDDYLLPGNTENQRKYAHIRLQRRLAVVIGKASFPQNSIRHTAASNMSEFSNMSSAANQLGHNESVLKRNYRKPINREDATAYFNISPDCCDAEKLRAYARTLLEEARSIQPN